MPNSRKKAKEPMHPADINAELKKADSSQAEISRHFGISDTSVSAVIKGRQKNHRVAKYISQIIKKPIDDIWPGCYNYAPRESYKERCQRAVA